MAAAYLVRVRVRLRLRLRPRLRPGLGLRVRVRVRVRVRLGLRVRVRVRVRCEHRRNCVLEGVRRPHHARERRPVARPGLVQQGRAAPG